VRLAARPGRAPGASLGSSSDATGGFYARVRVVQPWDWAAAARVGPQQARRNSIPFLVTSACAHPGTTAGRRPSFQRSRPFLPSQHAQARWRSPK